MGILCGFVEGKEFGNIAWKIELKNCSRSIDTVSVDFQHTTYENGTVNFQVFSDDKIMSIRSG